jgi:hypothetical protein
MADVFYTYSIKLVSGESWRFRSDYSPNNIYYWLDQGRVLRFKSSVEGELRVVPSSAVALIQTAYGEPNDSIDHWVRGGL